MPNFITPQETKNLTEEQILKNYEGFLVKLCKKYDRDNRFIEDYLQSAKLELLKRFKTYDPEYGISFVTYAKRNIENAIIEQKHVLNGTISMNDGTYRNYYKKHNRNLSFGNDEELINHKESNDFFEKYLNHEDSNQKMNEIKSKISSSNLSKENKYKMIKKIDSILLGDYKTLHISKQLKVLFKSIL